MPKDVETFSNRFAELLQHRGMNQTQAARVLGCSSGFISDLIHDVKRPGLDFLERLQAEFDVSLDWLVGGRGLPEAPRPIDLTTHRLIVGAVEVVRAGLLENDTDALLMVEELLREGNRVETLTRKQVSALQAWATRSETALLAPSIHNTNLNVQSTRARVMSAITISMALFQSRRVSGKAGDDADSNRRSPKSSPEKVVLPRLIMNVGESVRSAGRDYYDGGIFDQRGQNRDE